MEKNFLTQLKGLQQVIRNSMLDPTEADQAENSDTVTKGEDTQGEGVAIL